MLGSNPSADSVASTDPNGDAAASPFYSLRLAETPIVSDEHGGVDAVVDTASGKLLRNIPLGGGAGNTVYDSGSGHILV